MDREAIQATVTMAMGDVATLAGEVRQSDRPAFWAAVRVEVDRQIAPPEPISAPAPISCRCGHVTQVVYSRGLTRYFRCMFCATRGSMPGGRVMYRAKNR